MKTLLLNSCFFSERRDYLQNTSGHIRLGIASIASFLREKSIDVSILDPYVKHLSLGQIVDKIISEAPDYLCLPAYTDEINDAAKIAEAVKAKQPGITTIIGGPHASAIPAQTLTEFPAFDIAIIGEGELPILGIVKGEEKKTIPGAAIRLQDGKIQVNPPKNFVNLDLLPKPAWDLYEPRRYSFVSIDTVRGCPYSCVFCFRATGKNVRYRNPQKIVDDIEYGHKRFGFNTFSLTGGGTFPLEKKHALEVCGEIIRRGLKIRWVSGWRCDLVDVELLEAMQKSGCVEVALGIESGSDEILKHIKKQTSSEQVENAIKLCHKFRINVELNFIFGLPFDTLKSLNQTRRFAERMARYAHKINFAILTPFPGTAVYEMAKEKKNGLQIATVDWSKYSKQGGEAIRHSNFMPGELSRYQVMSYLSVYLRHPLKILNVFSVKRFIGFIKKVLSV